MKTKSITAAVFLSVITLLFGLIFVAPRAQAQGGVPLWTNRYHGPTHGPTNGSDYGWAVAADSSGNVYVAGSSMGNGTGYDYATIKYSDAGVPLWTNRYNGPGNSNDLALRIAVDSSGNVLVTGASIGTGGSDDTDYATIKYSNAGVPLWTNRYNGPTNIYDDLARTVAADSSGNAFVAVPSHSGRGPYDYDYVTIKYSNAGLVPLWTNRYVPDVGTAIPKCVAIAPNGDVFVTGFVVDWVEAPRDRDFVTVAYSSSGLPLWTNRYNGPADGRDEPNGIAVDSSGNVFVAGISDDTNYSDFAIIEYSGDGVPLCEMRFRGPADRGAGAYGVAVDSSGNVIVTGSAGTTNSLSGGDFVTIKYASITPPPAVHLTIERDGGHGYFVHFYGQPGSTYRLQRAASLTGPWSNLATNTAPASGLIEYHETNPPPGAGFYRTLQP